MHMVSIYFSFLNAHSPTSKIINNNYKSFLTLIFFDDNPSPPYETSFIFLEFCIIRSHAVGYRC